jgi:hypothetical protein
LEDIKHQLRDISNGTGSTANDFISRPGQPAQKFSKDDTIIVVKNPAAIGGGTYYISIQAGAFLGTEADAIKFAKHVEKYLQKIQRQNITL